MAITAEELLSLQGIAPAAAADRAWSQECAAAASDYVDSLPHVTPGEWPPRIRAGALMLAQRLYAARSAPLGAAGVDLTGSLVRATTDPEVSRLLGTGRYTRPRAG